MCLKAQTNLAKHNLQDRGEKEKCVEMVAGNLNSQHFFVHGNIFTIHTLHSQHIL